MSIQNITNDLASTLDLQFKDDKLILLSDDQPIATVDFNKYHHLSKQDIFWSLHFMLNNDCNSNIISGIR